MTDVSSSTTIVVGASRGLGRGIATALASAGDQVVAVARTSGPLTELAGRFPTVRAVVADATDPAVAGRLFDEHAPRSVVLVAGATPQVHPLQEHTWETFSVNWHTDVKLSFHWLQEALRRPLRPGSRVVVISSGAALQGSPLSGGYAGAKGTQRFITRYAQDESDRGGLGIVFTTVLPKLTPLTELGRPAVTAYAARSGLPEQEYLRQLGEPLTPDVAGAAVLELLRTDADALAPEHLLTGDGLRAVR
jgi:NAD(P)-dependent dehydrogenase (short-subunit alcohol dehydrogenase family)